MNALLWFGASFHFPKQNEIRVMKITPSSRIAPSRNSGPGCLSKACVVNFLEVPHASPATETRPFGFCIFRNQKQWTRSGPPAFGPCYSGRRFWATPGACPKWNVSGRVWVLQASFLYSAMPTAHELAGADLYRDDRQGAHLQRSLRRKRTYRLIPAGHNGRNGGHEIDLAERECFLRHWFYHSGKLARAGFMAAQHVFIGR